MIEAGIWELIHVKFPDFIATNRSLDGWGFKGNNGTIYHNKKPVKTMDSVGKYSNIL